MMILLLLIALTAIAIVAFLHTAPTFGASPSGRSIVKIEQSEQFKNGKFVNSVETKIDTRRAGESMDLTTYVFPADGKNPSSPLPSVEFDPENFNSGDFVWFGHSSILFRSGELTVITDPVFHRASPVPVMGKPFPLSSTLNVHVLPKIDIVLISHDHYDHLDHKSIMQLKERVKLFLVPLGVRSHLLRWGVPDANIIELDWYDSHTISNTVCTLTPTRHYSGRGFTNRNSTLWGSWVVKNKEASIFYSGDSGYFDGFKSIGDLFGPFDITFMENGAYDEQWSQVHMQPEESVQAAIDLNSKLYFPIHWGKFDLAKHQWKEPIRRAVQIANEKNIPIASPRIGEVFRLDSIPNENWWESS